MIEKDCPSCKSRNTFCAPWSWICLDCGHEFEKVEDWGKGSSPKVRVSVQNQEPAKEDLLPKVDEVRPKRVRIESAVEVRATAKTILRDMGLSERLANRVRAIDFVREREDNRITERNWKRDEGLESAIRALRGMMMGKEPRE